LDQKEGGANEVKRNYGPMTAGAEYTPLESWSTKERESEKGPADKTTKTPEKITRKQSGREGGQSEWNFEVKKKRRTA